MEDLEIQEDPEADDAMNDYWPDGDLEENAEDVAAAAASKRARQ